MEAVSSTRLGRASSRYGAPAVFSGPVRKWKKKWVHVPSPTTTSNNNSHSHNNTNTTTNNNSSRLLLRRWTPITAASPAADDDPHSSPCTPSDEPPRRKFRYTPIAVLEEQKNVVVEKAGFEPTTESDQLTARQTNVSPQMHGNLNMNEIFEDTKDSDIGQLDLLLSFQSNNDKNSLNNDDQMEEKNYLVDGP